jgi:hypothetical protein
MAFTLISRKLHQKRNPAATPTEFPAVGYGNQGSHVQYKTFFLQGA